MDIAVLLYDRCTALDVVGPYEVLSRLPGATVTFVATKPGPVRTDTGFLALTADRDLSELPQPDVVVVPGGPGQVTVMDDPALLSWLRTAHETTMFTTSVCAGSLILAAAGLLDARRATSHWLTFDILAALGAKPTSARVVVDGKLVTAAGVSAGIDMALALAARIAGDTVAQAIQLLIEYAPKPPFDAGSPDSAPAPIVDGLRGHGWRVVEPEQFAAALDQLVGTHGADL
ncbi:MAG TPA: DJ-1/PfpI family protein [Actinomycetes bacterium]|jgi:transcriptional regulator GlxA family with amidase domain|nr:DJ-1/PfpI family protein [Actinomycetes bacterium]